MLAGELTLVSHPEKPLRPAQVSLQDPVQRGLQRCESKSENSSTDESETCRPCWIGMAAVCKSLEAAQPGNDDGTRRSAG
jgi:hypothetical protein